MATRPVRDRTRTRLLAGDPQGPPEDFHDFLNVEAALVSLRQFETMLIPGLLQTADFTRALITDGAPGLAPDVVERRVLARMARQQILTRANPLEYHVIIEEAILERPVGTPRIMRNQLRRLIDEAAADHLTLQVLPKRIGASPAMDGPFSVLTLPEPSRTSATPKAPAEPSTSKIATTCALVSSTGQFSPSARCPRPTR